jgi:hypothetical protein
MAPAASTTVVWKCRAAHDALAVRLVQVTPAGERAPQSAGRAERNRARAAATRGAGRAINTASRRRAMGGRAQTRARYTHARNCNPMQSHEPAHALTQARIHARTHARTHHARLQMDTNTQMGTRTNAHAHGTHTPIARARSRT